MSILDARTATHLPQIVPCVLCPDHASTSQQERVHWPDGFRERAQAAADRVALTRATEAQARQLAEQCGPSQPIMAMGLRRLADQFTITPESSGQERA